MAKSKSKKSSQKRKTGTTSSTSSSASSSKSLTRKRREERQRKKQRNRQLAVAGIIALVIIVAIAGIFIANQPADAPIPEGTLERYDGIPQGVTSDGFARLGRADAPVRIEEFSSYSCPSCEAFWDSSFDEIVSLVREGKISFTFVPMLTGSIQNAEGAQRGAICAGEQGMYFEYHDMLFDWHTRHGNRAFSQNRLRSGAEELGLDTGAFNSCLNSGRAGDIVDRGVDEAQSRGVVGTPETYMNGVQVDFSLPATIRTQVDEAIAALGVVPIPITGEDDDGTDIEGEVTPEAEADVPVEDATDEPDSDDAEMTPEAVEATEEATAETDE